MFSTLTTLLLTSTLAALALAAPPQASPIAMISRGFTITPTATVIARADFSALPIIPRTVATIPTASAVALAAISSYTPGSTFVTPIEDSEIAAKQRRGTWIIVVAVFFSLVACTLFVVIGRWFLLRRSARKEKEVGNESC
ncbi:hypothetical protein GLAREA_09316 [Glarea lozoyensis ATCC 20868]|uniref:Uncharacterized protein n=1 Tax=Glarea lozoyensis (strain ATCC 20868 / MF5171) TaxID=1116229 RepID=S3EG48_GLAL2|nr:uncharacterized protein GLAREA_09316 [Glarea lozoyensis ATCC 20868]EPE37153.1 hypothetical protein GLAREA_09316 [Glarea lozoyensis ATCC 20868]